MTPNARIRSRLALLAWRRLEALAGFDRARILRVVRVRQDRGPEDVP